MNEERVLIFAPWGRDSALMCSALERYGLRCQSAATLAALAAAIREGAGVVVLAAEEALATGATNCLVDALRAQPNWSDLPMILLSLQKRSPDRALETFGPLSNLIILERPVRVPSFLSAVRAALEARRRQYTARDLLLRLEAAHVRLQATYEHAPIGIVEVDGHGNIARVNQWFTHTLGLAPEQLVGRPLRELECEEATPPPSMRAVSGKPVEPATAVRALQSNGSRPVWVEVRETQIRAAGAPEIGILVFRDLTPQLQAEAERIALRRQLIASQESERRRIARELHDETGQYVTALRLLLDSLTEAIPPDSPASARLEQLHELSDRLGEQLHRVALELRPAVLDDRGLLAAVSSYFEEWCERVGVRGDLHSRMSETRLPGEVETTLYRTIQESLTNVARHAAATHVTLILEQREGLVQVVIEDNGVGLPERNHNGNNRGGLGLAGMRERLALLGGSLQVESSAGGGTTIFARIPLQPEALVA